MQRASSNAPGLQPECRTAKALPNATATNRASDGAERILQVATRPQNLSTTTVSASAAKEGGVHDDLDKAQV